MQTSKKQSIIDRGAGVQGTIYLIHFDRPFGHASHYLGWTDNLKRRLYFHRTGRGARLMQVIRNAGIGWRVAATWAGDRHLERYFKGRGKSCVCPVCIQVKRSTAALEKLAIPFPYTICRAKGGRNFHIMPTEVLTYRSGGVKRVRGSFRFLCMSGDGDPFWDEYTTAPNQTVTCKTCLARLEVIKRGIKTETK